MKEKIFYTPIYSPDENGWYCDVFSSGGKTIDVTELRDTKSDAVKDVKEIWPTAKLIQLKELGI